MDPVLITGGAGYVGSHVVLACREAGYPVVVLDDLSTGHRVSVPEDVAFVEGDAGDPATAGRVIGAHRVRAVLHLAGSVSVPESLRDPLRYYRNNAGASVNLVRACVAHGVRRFVFSSTAAVYGVPSVVPVPEDAPARPISPYGRSKLACEWTLHDAAAAHDFRYVALRYFNVAGADPAGRAGQSSRGAEHLIKVACEAALGLRGHVTVFGTDYESPDGSGVRDYVHASDVADAHVAALRHLEEGGPGGVFNCGYGRGFSVREVLGVVQSVSGRTLEVREGARRPGDPARLVADASRIGETLRWAPRHDDLSLIVRSALAWARKRAGEAAQ